MKELMLITLIGFIPSISFSMEEKPAPMVILEEEKSLSKEEGTKLWWDTAFPLQKYGKESLPYEQYRENMKKAIIAGAEPQQHHYNPLIDAIHNRDHAFAEFLLKHGASPTFRGINMISGFDALRLRRGSVVDNPASIKKLRELLEKFKKEEITPYPMAGMNACYITDFELEQLQKEYEIVDKSEDGLLELFEILRIAKERK